MLALTIAYESSQLQEQADNVAAEQAGELRRELMQAVQTLQSPQPLAEMTRRHAALLHIERRDEQRRPHQRRAGDVYARRARGSRPHRTSAR